jgi:hypothetical protein
MTIENILLPWNYMWLWRWGVTGDLGGLEGSFRGQAMAELCVLCLFNIWGVLDA